MASQRRTGPEILDPSAFHYVQPVDAGTLHHWQTDRHSWRPLAVASVPICVAYAGHADQRGPLWQSALLGISSIEAIYGRIRSVAGPRPAPFVAHAVARGHAVRSRAICRTAARAPAARAV